ncbi:MAG: helix-turn-helix transcriptional regulator [Bacteroidia bacterium]
MKNKAAKSKPIKKNIEPELKELGKRIKQLRIERGYSSAEIFAYDNGLSRTSYTKCESGANMTYISLRRLLDIFDVSVQDFFSEGFE